VTNVGNFEVGLYFELGPNISSDFDIWHLDVPQGLTRPCNSKASSEGNLCVNCSLVKGISKHESLDIHGPDWVMDPDNFVPKEVAVGFVMRTLLILDQHLLRYHHSDMLLNSHLRVELDTIFCTIGCARIGKRRLRVSSVVVGTAG
jgi:hypothetical protein